MAISRRFRIFFLIVSELAQKYTRFLVMGFVLGLALTLLTARFYPIFMQQFFSPVERIGLVGEFTPNNLPFLIQQQLSSGLTTLKPDGAPGPGLAENWSATDSGKTFIFTLKKDALWHNGKPVTAQDVNYNIRNVAFTPIDDYTLQVTLDNAYSPFPTLVAKPIFQAGLRGFGPYKLSAIRLTGDKVSYLKIIPVDPRQKPNIVKEYRFYRTEAAAVFGYKLGEVDILHDMTSAYDLTKWGKNAIVENIKNDRIVALFFNLTDKMLSDKQLRQGLAYSVPALGREPAISPISRLSWAYTDKVKKYTHDPILAKKLLSDVISSSQSAALVLSTFPSFEQEAEIIAKSWTDIGIPTEVRIVNNVPSDYQILLSVQELPPDPDQYPFWHSTQTATNKTGLVNVKIDKLLEDGRQELDLAKRKAIYFDFQRYVVEDIPAAFLHYQTTYTIARQ